MADFGKCRKSLQTPWNASYMLADEFIPACGIVSVDFAWIRKGPKLADIEQKGLGSTGMVLSKADFGTGHHPGCPSVIQTYHQQRVHEEQQTGEAIG